MEAFIRTNVYVFGDQSPIKQKNYACVMSSPMGVTHRKAKF
jgi:hypothetical protein